MAVNDEIFKNLEVYGGGTINERVYNFLGSLGYTGTVSDRLGQFEEGGRKGWQGLIRAWGQWAPAPLFSQGQQGVWYEPKPEYLYQDAAGTVPVEADGDPVGYMQDRSGNGNHATQPTSAARPIYRTDGVLHWLQFDGVDDTLLMPDDIGMLGASDKTLLASGGSSSDSATVSLGDNAPGRRVTLRRNSGKVRVEIGGSGYTSTLDYPNATAVVGYRFTGSTLGDFELLSNNQHELAAGTSAVDTDTGSNVIGDNPAAPQQLQGNIYGIVAVERYLTDDLWAAQSYLANLAGIQL